MSTFISQRLRELREQEYFEKQALNPFSPIMKGIQAFKGWSAARSAAKASAQAASAAKAAPAPTNIYKRFTGIDKRFESGPYKGALMRDAEGKTIASGKSSLGGAIRQGLRGDTPTRADQLLKREWAKRYSASQKGVGFLDRPGLEKWRSQNQHLSADINKSILPQLKMSKMEFLKQHPGEAARWYGKQIVHKGATYGLPAYDLYDAATDPNRSMGEALGSAAGGLIGMGATGKAGFLTQMGGSIAGSVAGGALAGKAESVLRGQKRVPPPQFVPPPTLHAYSPPQPYQQQD